MLISSPSADQRRRKSSLKIHVPYTDLTYKETARATLKLRANLYPGDGPGRSSGPPAASYVHFCESKMGVSRGHRPTTHQGGLSPSALG